ELYLTVFRPPMNDGFGCLVTNSMIEFGDDRSPAADAIANVAASLDARLGAVLAREIGEENAPAMTARLILLYHGLLVLARAGQATAGVEGALRAQFAELRALRAQRSAINQREN